LGDSPLTMPGLRLPAGTKLIGANIIPKAADVAIDGGLQAWSQLLINWDWSGWVKPQIDALVGNRIGVNCIRMIGCNGGVLIGRFSQQYYDTRILQVARYCADLGVYFYACGGDNSNNTVPWGSASSNSAMADSFAQTFLQLQALPNVIGVDLIQETNNSNYGVANAFAMAQLVKARGVTLPIAISTSGEAISSASGGSRVNAAAQAGFDFLDVHLYTSFQGTGPVPANLFAYLRQAFPNKEVLIGEFGTSQGGDGPFEQSFGTDVLRLATSGDPMLKGALVWACSDQGTLNGDRWGVYNDTFAIRQTKANLLRRFTGGSASRPKQAQS
jgi:hypothetical protein